MMRSHASERGMALISALLLLLVTTVLGIAMFRGFALLESAARNTREKQRAMHFAEAAQTYAEWWLTQSQGRNATTGTACAAGLDSNLADTAICSVLLTNPSALPWTTGFYYSPPGMLRANTGAPGNYASAPLFYISYLGSSYNSTIGTQTNSYQVDAAGYAGTTNSAAVAESTYNVSITHTSQSRLEKFINLGGPSGDANNIHQIMCFKAAVNATSEISSGGTSQQLTSQGLPCLRARDSVLRDSLDSSLLWVGPAQTYDIGTAFKDQLWGTNAAPEETSYDAFRTAQRARASVVYVAANDGFVHGFRSRSLDVSGSLMDDSTTIKDGYEVLAYMPRAVPRAIHISNSEFDSSNSKDAHNWFAGATLSSGDVFYSGAWHTWLVGGLGMGGAAIYALDITNPGKFAETGTNGSKSTVVGEWSASNLTCVNVSNCQENLRNTYGTPLIRRFHSGSWGVIFGNGYGSSNNTTAGVYIMLIDPSSGDKSFYYLACPSTGNSAANGIASPTSVDVDLDHITDYVYAADLQGNVWRFDLTSSDPTKWAVTGTTPLFAAPSGSAITAGLTVSVLRRLIVQDGGSLAVDTSKPARVIVNFGTGRQILQSQTAPAQYASGNQYLFGIWDWNFNAPKSAAQPGWNALSNVKLVALDPNKGPATIAMSTLRSHTVVTVPQTAPAVTYRTISQEPVCWVVYETLDASSSCPNPGTQYGWYIQLRGAMEQILFRPVISPDGELVVNTFIPPQDSRLRSMTSNSSTGFSMAVAPGTGSADPGGKGSSVQSYFTVNTNNGAAPADALQLNGTGVPWFLSSGQEADHNSGYLITRTSDGATPAIPVNRHTVVAGKRLNWVQRR